MKTNIKLLFTLAIFSVFFIITPAQSQKAPTDPFKSVGPEVASGNQGHGATASVSEDEVVLIRSKVEQYFNDHPTFLGQLKFHSFVMTHLFTDDGGYKHVYFRQTYDGITIDRAYILAHLSPSGEVKRVIVNVHPEPIVMHNSREMLNAFKEETLQKAIVRVMDDSTRRITTPQFVWFFHRNRWILSVDARFQSQRDPSDVRVIKMSLSTGEILEEQSLRRYFSPYANNECLPTHIVWENFLERYEPEEEVNICFKPNNYKKVYLQDFPHNIVSYAPGTETPYSYSVDSLIATSYAHLQLKKLPLESQTWVAYFTQPLIAHLHGAKLLDLLKSQFKQDSYDGKGAPLKLLPNNFSISQYPGQAFTNGLGYIYFAQPHTKLDILDSEVVNSPGQSMVILAHEFFHNFSLHNTLTHCWSLEEGLATAFGYAVDKILSGDPSIWYSPPTGDKLVEYSSIAAEDNCQSPLLFEAAETLLVKLIEEGILESCEDDGCLLSAEPIGPHKVIYLLLKLIKYYSWENYHAFAESLYHVCVDSVGNSLNNGSFITEHDCDQIALINKISGFSTKEIKSIEPSPHFIQDVIDLELTDFSYTSTHIYDDNDCQLECTATIFNHAPTPWNHDLDLDVKNKPFLSLSGKIFNNFHIDAKSEKKIPFKIWCGYFLNTIPSPIEIKISPRKKTIKFIPGAHHQPTLPVQLATDYYQAKLLNISPNMPNTDAPTSFLATLQILNTGALPVFKEVPIRLRNSTGDTLATKFTGSEYPSKLSIVEPGEKYEVEFSFVGVPGETIQLLVGKPYKPYNELALLTFALPKAKKLENPVNLTVPPKIEMSDIDKDKRSFLRRLIQMFYR